jgi:hypothetical protein
LPSLPLFIFTFAFVFILIFIPFAYFLASQKNHSTFALRLATQKQGLN